MKNNKYKMIRIIIIVAAVSFLLSPLHLKASGRHTEGDISLAAEDGASDYVSDYDYADDEEEDYDDSGGFGNTWIRGGLFLIVSVVVGAFKKMRSTPPTSPKLSEAERKMVRENLEEKAAGYQDLLSKWTEKMNPTEFTFCFTEDNRHNLAVACIDYFARIGIFEEIDDETFRVVKRDGLSYEEKRVLEFLEKEGDFEDRADGLFVIEKFMRYLITLKHKMKEFNLEIQKAMEEKVAARLTQEEIEEFKKDRKALTQYMKYLSENDIDFHEDAGDDYLYIAMLYWHDQSIRFG